MKVLEASRSRLEAIASRLEVWGTKGKGHAVTGRLALEVLEAWRRHSNGFCNEPFLITDENVREAVPDLPEEQQQIQIAVFTAAGSPRCVG